MNGGGSKLHRGADGSQCDSELEPALRLIDKVIHTKLSVVLAEAVTVCSLRLFLLHQAFSS